MNATLSLPSQGELDQTMRLVARNLAMGIHDLPDILSLCAVDANEFERWKNNPRFLAYVKSETEAWNAANNVLNRTKLKAGFVIEEWLPGAYGELTNAKIPLNQRVELGKLVAKIAGMDSSPSTGAGASGDGTGFTLQINIGSVHRSFSNENAPKVIDADPQNVEEVEAIEAPPPKRKRVANAIELINADLGTPE